MTIVVSTNTSVSNNYSTLRDDIANWLARDDLEEEIRRFISLAESDICKDLRVRGQEKTVTIPTDAGTFTLPTDFMGARRVYVDVASSNRKLDYLSPERFHTSRAFSLTGTPQVYTIEGEQIKFAPYVADGEVINAEMLYLGAYEPLQNQADSNSLLEKYYDIYLYAALAHGFGFVRDNEEAAKFKLQYKEAVAALNRNANRERFFGNNLIATGTPTP